MRTAREAKDVKPGLGGQEGGMKGIWEIARLGLILMIVSAVSAGALSLTYAVTKDRIATQKKLEELEAVLHTLPAARRPGEFTELTADTSAAARAYPDLSKIYIARRQGSLLGYSIQMVPRGYGGPIQMAVGIDRDGRVAGVAIIDLKETPGLGGNVAEPEWLRQFRGKMGQEKLEVGVDVDAVSGATRSSRAVSLGVREALDAYHRFLERR